MRTIRGIELRAPITGGAGFIGSNVVTFFNQKDPSIEARVIGGLGTGSKPNHFGAKVEFVAAKAAA